MVEYKVCFKSSQCANVTLLAFSYGGSFMMENLRYMDYISHFVYCRELAPDTVRLTGDRVHGDDSKQYAIYTGIMFGVTECMACLSPIPISSFVSCSLSSRHSTQAPSEFITTLAWAVSKVSSMTESPVTLFVMRCVNSFFISPCCANNLQHQNTTLILDWECCAIHGRSA